MHLEVHDENNNPDEAKKNYMTIYEVDIDFKDVQKKIEV